MKTLTATEVIASYSGRDDFGPFLMALDGINAAKGLTCAACHSEVNFAVRYKPGSGFHLPKYKGRELTPAETILKKRTNVLGVTCGCYAKLHRQVCHITAKERYSK